MIPFSIWVTNAAEIEYQHRAWSNFVRDCFETGDDDWFDRLKTEHGATLSPDHNTLFFENESQLTVFLLRWS
jgi:hypothetical protein